MLSPGPALWHADATSGGGSRSRTTDFGRKRMSGQQSSLTRRAFGGGLAASTGLMAATPFGRALAQTYPNRRISVVIPTGQGGGAERIARPFDAAWGQLLKTQFEYSFFPGAAGQI